MRYGIARAAAAVVALLTCVGCDGYDRHDEMLTVPHPAVKDLQTGPNASVKNTQTNVGFGNSSSSTTTIDQSTHYNGEIPPTPPRTYVPKVKADGVDVYISPPASPSKKFEEKD